MLTRFRGRIVAVLKEDASIQLRTEAGQQNFLGDSFREGVGEQEGGGRGAEAEECRCIDPSTWPDYLPVLSQRPLLQGFSVQRGGWRRKRNR